MIRALLSGWSLFLPLIVALIEMAARQKIRAVQISGRLGHRPWLEMMIRSSAQDLRSVSGSRQN